MARVRVLKRQNAAYVELPKEMLGYDELELFQLREGYYLLSVPLPAPGSPQPATQGREPEAGGAVQASERSVLKKLLGIKFENRTPANVAKLLSDEEREVLGQLEAKRLVNVFRGTKYREGVYNISDAAYALATGSPKHGAVSREPGAVVPQTGVDSAGILVRQGYLVIGDRNEARALSEKLSGEMKAGNIVGVKGFDGKFYIVTKAYLLKAQAAISAVLKESMDAAGIAAAAKLEGDGCVAVLHVLSESGDIIEKKRGIYAPV